MWAYLIVFYTLHPHRNKPDLKFRVRDFLLLTVIVILNIIMVKLNLDNRAFPIVAIVLQLGCMFVIIRGQFFALPEKIKKICRYNKWNIHIAYRYWYSIFLFSWLLLVAIFPTYLIFEKAQFLVDKIWLKTDQIYMARKYMAKEKALEKNLPAFKNWEGVFKALYREHLREGLYPVFADSVSIVHEKDPGSGPKANDSIFREFLWNTRPIYDERVSRFKALVYQEAQDASWISAKESDTLTLKYLDQKGAIQLTLHSPKETTKGTLGFLTLKVSGIVLILAILFSLILFFVDRFFAFRFRHLKPNDFDTNPKENYVKKFGRMLLDDRSNSGLLLIGLPFSGKRAFTH